MKNSYGVSLFEMLISLMIFSIIMLELNMTKYILLKELSIISYQFKAVNQMNAMLSILLSYKTFPNKKIIDEWNRMNQLLLPNGYGKIIGYYPDYVIQLFWGNNSNNQCHQNKIGINGCLCYPCS